MEGTDSVDLRTTYLGLQLSSPIVASAGPLTRDLAGAKALADAGVGAVVLPSLFEEEIVAEEVGLSFALEAGSEHFAEALDYFPTVSNFTSEADRYLELLEEIKKAVRVPVIASLNASSTGGWVRYAKEMEQAGADAIELNTYALATNRSQTSAELELQLLELVDSVCNAVKAPVAVKLSQSFTSVPHLVARLEDAGARGVVLFNRFYQPDFDIETLEVRPTLHFSTPSELLPRLHWAAILYGHLNIDLAISGGVHSAEDVLKGIMAGAGITMMCSALHIHGIEHIGRVLTDVRYWLEKREYSSLWETRGCLSRSSVPDTSPFDRGNYIKTLSSYSLRQTVTAF